MTLVASTRPYALKFQVADRTLLAVNLRVETHSVSVAHADSVTLEPPAVDSLQHGAVGFLYRACPLEAGSARLLRIGPWLRYVVQSYGRCSIDLRQTFDAYRGKFSSKTRSTLLRKVRKWEEFTSEPVRWEVFRSPEELRRFHPLARQVSSRSYQERLLDAGLPGDQAFINEMSRLASQDSVRGYILFHGTRPVSYLYCPVIDGVVIYEHLGYDPDYLPHSVGTILQWHALEDLFAERRFSHFDFTEGETDHKRLFATRIEPSANVLFVRFSALRWCLLYAHSRFDAVVAQASSLATRWGLKAKLRRWQRFGRSSA